MSIESLEGLRKVAEQVVKILSAKTTSKKELYDKQVEPIYAALKSHNETFVDISLTLKNALASVTKNIDSNPNDVAAILLALENAKTGMDQALSEGQTDRSSLRNISAEFAQFPFYSKPVVGWIDDEYRQLVIDYFDSVVAYFNYGGGTTHAMRHSLELLKSILAKLERSASLEDIRDGVDQIHRELDLANKHMMDRWGLIAGKKGRIEAEANHA